MKLLKFLIGLLLLPACVAVTLVFRDMIFGLLLGELLFFIGAVSYLFLLAVFQQPIRTYIFGHELTHVLWIWLFGGRVKKFRVTAAGGRVKADRSNFLIFLAPYFFPVYTALAVLIYLVVTLITDHPAVPGAFAFAVGFTWTFHLTFTIFTLLQRQPDVTVNGVVFSLPLIYLGNVMVLSLLLIFVSGNGIYQAFFARFWESSVWVYGHIWTESPRWGEELTGWFRALIFPDRS